MSINPRWHNAMRMGLVGVVSCALVVGAATTSASAATQPSAPAPAVAAPAATASSSFAEELESEYVDPDRVYSTDVRWWLGEASATDETLLEEIQALYDAGFRGVELCMQNDNGAADATYAYGSEMWTHKWNLMMNKLLDLGMAVYLTSGTNWATSNVPGLDPASQQAMQNLTLGTSTVNPGASITALTAPAANARRAGATFVTAYAYKVVSGNTVDPNSFIDLKPLVTQGADAWTQNLNWTAPTDGTYRVFGMWTQGTYQTAAPSATPSYATNYFDVRGVQALKTFWEAHYLSDPALRAKIAAGDVQLFMDSLEINTGNGFTWWAEDMAKEFKARKGYDITPYLFLISGVASNFNSPYTSTGTTGTYKLDGDEVRRQGIVNDYQDVLTQLYRERMLQPLKTWLNSVGIETRAQISYGKALELSEPAMDVDYPEAENLNQYNQVDVFRDWTGGAKLENKVLSSETTAVPLGWNATYQKRLQDAYSTYAAGFQRIVWHVWAAEYGYGNFQWPGFDPSPFNLKFPLLGGRNPGAENYDELNAHLGRVQQLMQTGVSRTDVGFIQQKWVHGMVFGGGTGNNNNQMNWQLAHQGISYRSTELQDNGYTYDYFSPKFLSDDDVSFNETTKTIEKAGYKAIVLYQDWLDLDGAKKIRDWAKKGLKVVILEDAGSRTPYNDGKDAELAAVMAELKGLSTVRTADVFDTPAAGYFSTAPGGYDDNVMEKLQELGVYPYSGYADENHQLLSQTRQDADGNQYVYTYNYDDGSYRQNSAKESVRNETYTTNIQTEIVQDGQFIPHKIDAWTGEVTELADYRWEDGKTVVPIDLDYNNISLLAFEKVSGDNVHIVSTDAESAHAVVNGVAVRATETGNVTTELSNGTDYVQAVTVPQPYDITNWDLTVQSWRPNPTAGNLTRSETIGSLTTTNRKTSTVKTPISVKLPTLTTWNNIPAIGQAVSGEGHYEATFNWDARRASGAYLDFGDKLQESMVVRINGKKVGGEASTNPTKRTQDVGGVGKATIDDGTGQQVPLVGDALYTGGVNWMKPLVDVSPYLVDGQNKIVIDYNSVLSNVQVDRKIVSPVQNASGWWGYHIGYLEFGPKQAKIVPFVDVEYSLIGSIADPLAELRAAGDITNGAKTSLQIRLDRATAALATGDDAGALADLRDFVKHVPSVVKDEATRTVLIRAAEGVIAELQQRVTAG